MVLQIVRVLFEGREFGVEVVDDVFGVEGGKQWWVIFFVVVRGSHRGGAGSVRGLSTVIQEVGMLDN